jgi:hypothetical protein
MDGVKELNKIEKDAKVCFSFAFNYFQKYNTEGKGFSSFHK